MRLSELLRESMDDVWEQYYDVKDDVWHAFNHNKPVPFKVTKKNVIFSIWKQYARDGFVRNEPLVNKLAERFIHNVLVLQINTEWVGHTELSPEEDESYSEFQSEEVREAFYDWTKQAFSDFGLKPLWELITKLVDTIKPEEKVVIMDQILNVTHQRGDLASYFIEGGQQSLTELSNINNLNESKTPNINITNIIQQLLKDSSLVDYYSENEINDAFIKFKKEYSKYSHYQDIPPENTPEYKKFEEWLINSYTPTISKNIINRIIKLQQNGYFNIYRVIEVDGNLKPTDKLGIYWSFDESAAYPYDASFNQKNNQYMLYGRVSISSVNWLETVIVNIINPWEKELQIIENKPITLLKVIDWKTKKEINIGDNRGKEFKA